VVESPVTTEIEFLSQVRLFESLTTADLAEVASSVRRRSFSKGEVVYHQDDPPGSLYIITRGTIKLQASSATGRLITIAWLKTGNFFGTMSLFGEITRAEDAVALEPVELLIMPRDDYRALIQRHPEAIEAVLQVLSIRWRRATQRLCDMACLDVPGRIAKILLDFIPTFGETAPDGTILIRLMTQPELASLIGATRESVHNTLNAFARQGWIEFQRGSVRILQPEGLRERLNS